MTTVTRSSILVPVITRRSGDSGDYVGSVDFTLPASDSFVRSNGALGNTDGAGTDGVTGGSGVAWTDSLGTWVINSNTAACSALDGGLAIATLETGVTDGVVMSKPNAIAGLTVANVVRYIDNSNYVRAQINQVGQWAIYQTIAGTPTSLLGGSGVSFSTGTELVTTVMGRRVSVEYNGVYLGSVAISDTFDAATKAGILQNSTSGSVNFAEWHFIKLPAYEARIGASVVKMNTGEYLVTTPVEGDLTRCAEWDIRQEKTIVAGYAFTSNVRRIYALNLVTVATGAKEVLQFGGSGWESAQIIGADADVVGDYGYFGSIHQSEQLQTFSIAAQPHTISRWYRYYAPVKIDQTMNTIYPADAATTIGTTTMRHYFSGVGFRLTRSHTYSAGYKLYGAYGAMMPFNTTAGVMDRYQVGTEDAAAIAADGNPKNSGTLAEVFKAWLNGGDFTLQMTLPTGGPEETTGYTNGPDNAGWMSDSAVAPQKFYANYVDTNFADIITAAASSHSVHYKILNGTP